MKERSLTVRSLQFKANRKPTGHKAKPSRSNHWWGIDMTKVMIEGFGWLYVVIVLDWHRRRWGTTQGCWPGPGIGWPL